MGVGKRLQGTKANAGQSNPSPVKGLVLRLLLLLTLELQDQSAAGVNIPRLPRRGEEPADSELEPLLPDRWIAEHRHASLPSNR